MGWFQDALKNTVEGISNSVASSGNLKKEQVDRLDANTKIALLNAQQKIEAAKRQDDLLQNVIYIISSVAVVYIVLKQLKK